MVSTPTAQLTHARGSLGIRQGAIVLLWHWHWRDLAPRRVPCHTRGIWAAAVPEGPSRTAFLCIIVVLYTAPYYSQDIKSGRVSSSSAEWGVVATCISGRDPWPSDMPHGHFPRQRAASCCVAAIRACTATGPAISRRGTSRPGLQKVFPTKDAGGSAGEMGGGAWKPPSSAACLFWPYVTDFQRCGGE